MGKYVLYKENGEYKFTNEANYGSRITNANQIATFRVKDGFGKASDVVDYICKYSRDVSRDDIRILTESVSSAESRFDGLVDQIDVLVNMIVDHGTMSPEQQEQLSDLRDHVAAFGERGQKWAGLCDEIIGQYSPKLESMMEFYANFVERLDCPPALAEAALTGFKEILIESSSDVAEQLRQRVGSNPNEKQGIGVFGTSGDDNLPKETTIDNAIADSMASGTFDTLGDDIATADPNNFDETTMGLGSSENDSYGNELKPDNWPDSVTDPVEKTIQNAENGSEETITETDDIPENPESKPAIANDGTEPEPLGI